MSAETVAAVVIITADGESREAKTYPDGSYSCPFCGGAVISPEGHAETQRANAEIYERTGETYEPQPYSESMRQTWEARGCGNPACLSVLSLEAVTAARERIKQHQEYLLREAERAASQARYADEQRREREQRIDSARAESERDGWCFRCWYHDTGGLGTRAGKRIKHRKPENCPQVQRGSRHG